MTQEEIRKVENYALSRPLEEIEDEDMLRFLATLIQDHDHLREILMTESDPRIRREKLECMRAYLKFKAHICDEYELAEMARRNGVQPIYSEQEKVSKIWMPHSEIHEVPR